VPTPLSVEPGLQQTGFCWKSAEKWGHASAGNRPEKMEIAGKWERRFEGKRNGRKFVMAQ
jgi:hypothetical protein